MPGSARAAPPADSGAGTSKQADAYEGHRGRRYPRPVLPAPVVVHVPVETLNETILAHAVPSREERPQQPPLASREWHQFAEAADGWSAAAAAWEDANDERKKTTLRRLARLETDLPSPPPLPLPVVPLLLEERCVVCGTHERTNAFVPCGHKAACEACAAQLLDTTRRCPVPGCAAQCMMSLRVSFAVTPPTTSRTPCNSPELQ